MLGAEEIWHFCAWIVHQTHPLYSRVKGKSTVSVKCVTYKYILHDALIAAFGWLDVPGRVWYNIAKRHRWERPTSARGAPLRPLALDGVVVDTGGPDSLDSAMA